MEPVVNLLIKSIDPAIQYQTRISLLGEDPHSTENLNLREQIRQSKRVQQLLSERRADGRIPCHPYKKWYGAHWVLVSLAEMNYPPGDHDLYPLRDQVLDWLFSDDHARHIITVQERVRRCASQESNAVYSLLSLGIADERVDELVQRLIKWQWPDGGWNCDKRPDVTRSSFMETITPLRALAFYARITGNSKARAAADRAAEIFLKRRLFKRLRDGEIIDHAFVTLHFPLYWHYDFLFGLKVLADAGFIGDDRCQDALTLLRSMQLPSGGFPAQAKYYRAANPGGVLPISQRVSGYSLLDWGPVGKTSLNEFVTVNALAVLR